MSADERVLRHMVIFGFSSETTDSETDEIVRRFAALRELVPGIDAFEWGPNTSPEDLNPELTHCFLLTFRSEQARDRYLVDPAHVAFADWVGTWVEHVRVVDFWADADRPVPRHDRVPSRRGEPRATRAPR